MNTKFMLSLAIGMITALTSLSLAQSPRAQSKVKPAGTGSSVKGNGTPDHITKWVSASDVGDSEMIESGGSVGLGTTPSSLAKFLVVCTLDDAGSALRGINNGTGRGVTGVSENGIGVNGGGKIGVNGVSTSSDPADAAVRGIAPNGALAGKFMGSVEVDGQMGVGQPPSSIARLLVLDVSDSPNSAIRGVNNGTGRGVMGISQLGIGVNAAGKVGLNAVTTSTNPLDAAVRGISQFGGSLAGDFQGDVAVSGMLSKGGGSFKIDHPLDPENKYLYHSFVESPDMMNIYNGNATTDENGEAVVTLPDYFEALNGDFRYQLTCIGSFAQAMVSEKIKGNRFQIRTSAPNIEVSWQVTGVRHDAFAKKNRIQVEVEKGERERGSYLHPEAFRLPKERGVNQKGNPEMQ